MSRYKIINFYLLRRAQKRVRTLFGKANINGLTVFKWRYAQIILIQKISLSEHKYICAYC